MNKAKKLPDAYAKSTSSNVYKLLQIANLIYHDFYYDLKKIEQYRDLNVATGKTLDRYGEFIGVTRNGETDEKYRIKLFAKIGRNTTNTDCNSVIRAIAQVFNIDPTTIKISEKNMTVHIIGLTIAELERSGYTSTEIKEMLQELTPVGVSLEAPYYAGSLQVDEPQGEPQTDYPVLQSAWISGQVKAKDGDEYEIGEYGLSGDGNVPDDWKLLVPQKIRDLVKTSGPFEGGTLGILG